MKDHSTTINQLGFTNSETIAIQSGPLQTAWRSILKRKTQLIDLMQTLGAILTIGCLFFGSIYLFLIQLAKYGWQ